MILFALDHGFFVNFFVSFGMNAECKLCRNIFDFTVKRVVATYGKVNPGFTIEIIGSKIFYELCIQSLDYSSAAYFTYMFILVFLQTTLIIYVAIFQTSTISVEKSRIQETIRSSATSSWTRIEGEKMFFTNL